MNMTLVEIDPTSYHAVCEHQTVYRILKSTVWGNKWRAFTFPGNVFVVDQDTLEEMRKYLEREHLV